MAINVQLTVNGVSVRPGVDPNLPALRSQRDELKLTGCKEGSSTGDCRSCAVLVDGRPVDSCLFHMKRVPCVRVETSESLASADGPLSPLQVAFLESGAVQCGFCTPGMIMAAKALLDSNSLLHRLHADIRCHRTGCQVACLGRRGNLRFVKGAPGEVRTRNQRTSQKQNGSAGLLSGASPLYRRRRCPRGWRRQNNRPWRRLGRSMSASKSYVASFRHRSLSRRTRRTPAVIVCKDLVQGFGYRLKINVETVAAVAAFGWGWR